MKNPDKSGLEDKKSLGKLTTSEEDKVLLLLTRKSCTRNWPPTTFKGCGRWM